MDGENVKAMKKPEEAVPKAKLLNGERRLTERAKKVFSDIFEIYSHEGKMSKETCAAFTQQCCGI